MNPDRFAPGQRAQPADASAVETVPGALRGQAWLTVQTRQAQRLIRGRSGTADKSAIIGLVGFADRLRVIWHAARSDDPYAHWWLIKVDEALEGARERIANERSALDAALEQVTALEVAVAESTKPYRIALQFANPYAYRGAQLIADYDTFVRTLLTAQHVGIVGDATTEGLLNGCARKIRGVLALPQGYRFLGIDRAAVRQQTATAQRARQAMGEVPEEILNGERKAALAPRLVRFTEEAAQHLRLAPVETASGPAVAAPENDDGSDA